MVTTDGSISAAAAATVPSSLGVLEAGVPVTLIGVVFGNWPELSSAYEPTPAPAPITADIDAATRSVPSRKREGRVAVAVATAPPGASGGTPAGAGKSAGPYPDRRSIGTVGSCGPE